MECSEFVQVITLRKWFHTGLEPVQNGGLDPKSANHGSDRAKLLFIQFLAKNILSSHNYVTSKNLYFFLLEWFSTEFPLYSLVKSYFLVLTLLEFSKEIQGKHS